MGVFPTTVFHGNTIMHSFLLCMSPILYQQLKPNLGSKKVFKTIKRNDIVRYGWGLIKNKLKIILKKKKKK